ncbi:MAG: hypothetical protein NC907_00200 [Candidatus Omnitrophica bacterium]|nr:hypothetical protein [Candidatus Omnitrophota bacterium]MCM8788193.1 hypothetical protein [Candidatus Omnitrophota bacterium]
MPISEIPLLSPFMKGGEHLQIPLKSPFNKGGKRKRRLKGEERTKGEEKYGD